MRAYVCEQYLYNNARRALRVRVYDERNGRGDRERGRGGARCTAKRQREGDTVAVRWQATKYVVRH